ncbi:uncharacterized protein MONBRDRAFT_8784 [Monosiga brevicollis MX1]|uniref:Uncharacterized protein n=1 Tax=Monosiga brevicollis TaxID=81824 RepID=A9V146_MONBE|nr:uncharacterized protein MONBRDRAFT_8784 [Monosiga brevicollis MX1]EDQ88869.1 predicted protein [Monosiga brevicollis MX1]|eukprot:XP_001746482.1 hypothetical protein [Monosiga brevicollis MX1]
MDAAALVAGPGIHRLQCPPTTFQSDHDCLIHSKSADKHASSRADHTGNSRTASEQWALVFQSSTAGHRSLTNVPPPRSCQRRKANRPQHVTHLLQEQLHEDLFDWDNPEGAAETLLHQDVTLALLDGLLGSGTGFSVRGRFANSILEFKLETMIFRLTGWYSRALDFVGEETHASTSPPTRAPPGAYDVSLPTASIKSHVRTLIHVSIPTRTNALQMHRTMKQPELQQQTHKPMQLHRPSRNMNKNLILKLPWRSRASLRDIKYHLC